jgi:tRNA(Ile)-lysidine synthase
MLLFYSKGQSVSRVCEAILAAKLSGSGIIAVSGGPDSVALAVALAELYDRSQLTIAHINHQLRGEESHEDEQFVRKLAESLSIALEIAHRPILNQAGIEESAREARYEWLHSISQGRWICTAHTANDRAETILHRVIRGTGIRGLAGIENTDTVVRPFLTLYRQDILQYLDEKKQPYRTDSSNVDQRFTRNKIRHDLLPRLAELNPTITDKLNELGDLAAETTEFMDGLVSEELKKVERPRAGTMVILDAQLLEKLNPLLSRELFRKIWLRENWTQRGMKREHWFRLSKLVLGDYPDGIRLSRIGQVLRIEKV